jgi:hypothetical protein
VPREDVVPIVSLYPRVALDCVCEKGKDNWTVRSNGGVSCKLRQREREREAEGDIQSVEMYCNVSKENGKGREGEGE